MSLRMFLLIIISVILLASCNSYLTESPSLLEGYYSSPQPSDHLQEIDISPWSQHPEGARDVRVITAGDIRGEGLEIIAIAGEEILFIGQSNGLYHLGHRAELSRYISSAVARDLTGDGRDELILAGATTPRWEDEVDGWLGVFTYRDNELTLLAELSTDTMPLWSCATKNTGVYGETILASNGHNLYVFSLAADTLSRTAVLPEFAGSIATTQAEEKQGLMAWRSEGGHSYGLYAWDNQKLIELWRIDSEDRWASTIPAIGDMSGNGEYVAAFQGRDGQLRMFYVDGSVFPVPERLLPVLAEAERLAPPVLIDVTGDRRVELMLGRRTNVVIYEWVREN